MLLLIDVIPWEIKIVDIKQTDDVDETGLKVTI